MTTWLTKFHRNAFYGPEINGNPIVYIGDLTFKIRARAVRHVIRTRGRSVPLEQKVNLHQVGEPLKAIPTCSSTDIYRMCRTRHFCWKGQCATEILLLNTLHDGRCCRHASDDATLMQFDWHAGWGRQRYLPPRLHGDMATPTTIALDSSFNLLLISRILVDSDGNCQHHVIIGLRPRDRPARRDNPLGSWCQQHTSIHD